MSSGAIKFVRKTSKIFLEASRKINNPSVFQRIFSKSVGVGLGYHSWVLGLTFGVYSRTPIERSVLRRKTCCFADLCWPPLSWKPWTTQMPSNILSQFRCKHWTRDHWEKARYLSKIQKQSRERTSVFWNQCQSVYAAYSTRVLLSSKCAVLWSLWCYIAPVLLVCLPSYGFMAKAAEASVESLVPAWKMYRAIDMGAKTVTEYSCAPYF